MNKAQQVEAILPLAPPQKGMLLESLSSGTGGLHVEQMILGLEGPIDRDAFQTVWQKLVRRHAMLRTGFVWKDQPEPLQVVLRDVGVPLTYEDLRSHSGDDQQRYVERLLGEQRRPFQMARPPLLRLALLRIGKQSYRFVMSFHHILMDGWCGPLLLQEFLHLYGARHHDRPITLPHAASYREFLTWLERQDVAAAELFWRKTFADFKGMVPMAVGSPTWVRAGRTAEYDFVETLLPQDLTCEVMGFASRHCLTPNSVLLGAWVLLTARYSRQRDVVIGITTSGRPIEIPGMDRTIGLFAGTVPLRVVVDPATQAGSWLRALQASGAELRQWDFTSGGQVHQWSEIPASKPLFESLFVYENYPVALEHASQNGLEVSSEPCQSEGARTRTPLAILISPGREMRLRLVFDTRRIQGADGAQLLEHYTSLVSSILRDGDCRVDRLLATVPEDLLPLPNELPPSDVKSSRPAERPQNAIQELLVLLWREVLGVEPQSIYDSFFELGGHSLVATQVAQRIRETFHIELPLRVLFERPTVAATAAYIQQRLALGEGDSYPPLAPVPREGELPLAPAQERLWFLQQLDTGSSAYTVPAAVRLVGELDLRVLRKALGALLDRHEALRTIYREGPAGLLQSITSLVSLPLLVIDFSGLPHEQQQIQIAAVLRQAAAFAFKLDLDPPLRFLLFQVGPREQLFVVLMHHITCDAWSLQILLRDLTHLYEACRNNSTPSLPDLPVQYADYAVWHRQVLASGRIANELAYWKRQLAGAPVETRLPFSLDRPLRPTHAGTTHTNRLSAVAADSLSALAREEKSTLFMALLAAWMILIYGHTGAKDILVGTDLAGRTHSWTENLIGFFVNTLPIRGDLSGDPTFRELIRRLRSIVLDMHRHQTVPFSGIISDLAPGRNLGRIPFIQNLLVVQNAPTYACKPKGLSIEPLAVDELSSRFDLGLFVTESPDGLELLWKYSTELFEQFAIEELANSFVALIQEVVQNSSLPISRLKITSDVERKQMREIRSSQDSEVVPRLGSSRRKAINISGEGLVCTRLLHGDEPLPLVIEPNGVEVDLAQWASSHRDWLEDRLNRHGGILFRSFQVQDVPDFERVARAVSGELYDEYGDLPREPMGGKVYGSTPYPADQSIRFHNEGSHQHCWPMKQWFFCVLPAARGGETLILDSRKAYHLLHPDLREEFERKGLLYSRNYIEGLDISWREFFRTSNRSTVEEYCQSVGVEYQWLDDGSLRTSQRRPAVLSHPRTGEKVFFNQLLVHHVDCLELSMRSSILSMFSEERLPRNVYFGDGTPITAAMIAEIQRVYDRIAVPVVWTKGDIVLLDNMLAAHARMPFVGQRKIVVALGEMADGRRLQIQ